ncbi:D-alanyl-D-alanine carboxypeptidase [Streptomyces sp. NPDC001381]|uniref:D-alanyl-D-alanine carboxypeptidase n=1 Tax=Streptomyces sp. NPDC001381 TaxID=3364567 RepID=UPI0036B7435A
MAGESPDRSKQRESSAEPTSGSAGTVPEAREPRDPRVAVARDSGASASESASRGGVDTATRVFSVRELEIEDPEDASAKADGAGGDASEAAGGPDGSEGVKGAGEGAESPSEASDASGDAGSPSEAAEDAEPDPDASGGPEASEEAGDDAGDTDGGAEGRSEDAAADADDAPESELASDARSSAKPAPKWASRDDADDTDDADVADDEGAAGETGDEDRTTDGEDKKREKEEKEEDGDKRDEAAESDDSPASPASDRSPVDQPTAIFKAPRPKPTIDQPTTMLKLGDAARPKPAPEDEPADDRPAADKPEAAEAATDKTDAGKAAVGKAATDRTDADKTAADKAAENRTGTRADADDAGSEAAPPADRTSRFVALKPLDEPRPPKAAADVTALVPQVGPERTTQQPLPPKPPLDLLAELTNTPPPPPTPLRTLGRRIKIWTPLLILLVIVFAIVQAVRPLPATSLTLTAKDSYTFEGGKASLPWPSEGQGAMDVNGIGTMDSFGEEKPVAIGSVAKAMTAYIVLKDHPLKAGEEGPGITVDALAEKEGGYYEDGESTLATVKEGDKLTEKQALSAIMIPSANNIARLLARWDAGSEAAFIKKMNTTAKELGMTNTTYTDASGLKETTVSTAADQVKLGNELVKIPALVEITKLPEWTDPSGTKHRNYNTLVPYDNAIGIKTGSTTAAGGNLLFAATKEAGGETVTVVGAILGQHKVPIIDTVNAVSKTALLAAQDAITSAKILKKGDVVGYVDDQLGGHTPVVVTKDVPAVGWAGLTVKLSFAADDVPHTAKAGTRVGTLTVGDASGGAVEVPVALQSDLAEPGFPDKLTRLG